MTGGAQFKYTRLFFTLQNYNKLYYVGERGVKICMSHTTSKRFINQIVGAEGRYSKRGNVTSMACRDPEMDMLKE